MAIVGQVQNGFIAPGMKIDLEGNLYGITAIEMRNQQVAQANANDNAGLIIVPLQINEEFSKKSFWKMFFQKNKDPRFEIFHNYLNTLINIF